ncbi:hypothetical protein IW262DRAFT_518825 [Armillaria fumosa]|nr:hypothetical protein IW262DRAFT_518825 [Armillaria fumosa]
MPFAYSLWVRWLITVDLEAPYRRFRTPRMLTRLPPFSRDDWTTLLAPLSTSKQWRHFSKIPGLSTAVCTAAGPLRDSVRTVSKSPVFFTCSRPRPFPPIFLLRPPRGHGFMCCSQRSINDFSTLGRASECFSDLYHAPSGPKTTADVAVSSNTQPPCL